MEDVHILLFYKYVDIDNPKKFVKSHLKFCKKLGILGKVLVGAEGINGSVSGTKEQIEEYREHMRSDARFEDMNFKEDVGKAYPFTRLFVRVRDEIVALGIDVDLGKKGEHISPKDFLDLYSKENPDDLVILDARNDYGYKVGRFKNAIHLDIKTFRDFPEAVKRSAELKEAKEKGKRIAMYCTGGIRCEKASAFLKEEGFQDVAQLENGIINFCKQFPDTAWEGNLFVFDKRLVTPVNEKDVMPVAKCEICGDDCDLFRNCRNVKCDKLFIECVPCQAEMNGCCSEECLLEFRIQCDEKSRRKQGRRVVIKNII
jgi:UPF0176 protein